MSQDRRRGERCGEALPEVGCSMSWAASFATGGRNGAREEWSRRRPESERVQGRKYLFVRAILEKIERA
jgi:hypothetical protein